MSEKQLPTPKQIRAYLVAREWHEENRLPPAGVMFSHEIEPKSDGPITLFVPELEEAIDYPPRVSDVVATLAAFERRPEAAVRAEIFAQMVSQPVSGRPDTPEESITPVPAEPATGKGA